MLACPLYFTQTESTWDDDEAGASSSGDEPDEQMHAEEDSLAAAAAGAGEDADISSEDVSCMEEGMGNAADTALDLSFLEVCTNMAGGLGEPGNLCRHAGALDLKALVHQVPVACDLVHAATEAAKTINNYPCLITLGTFVCMCTCIDLQEPVVAPPGDEGPLEPQYLRLFLLKYLCPQPGCFGTMAPAAPRDSTLQCAKCGHLRTEAEFVGELEAATAGL